MQLLQTAIQWMLFACLSVSAAYLFAAVIAAFRWRNSSHQKSQEFPLVSIFKPLCGNDPQLATNLRAICSQDYPEYQVIFGALEENDPALAIARSIADDFPDKHILVTFGTDILGFNRKVCNLANIAKHARHDLWVLCDSDMWVQPNYLRRLVAPFADPLVGLVTCPYRGYLPASVPSKLEALGIGADFIPSAFVAYFLTGRRFAFGSTIAVRQGIVEKMGGFGALSNHLADDYCLAQHAVIQGFEVVLSDYVVDDCLGVATFSDMWSRRLRWAITARAMQPAAYCGGFITHTISLAVLFALTGPGWPIAIGAILIAIALRVASVAIIAAKVTNDDVVLQNLALLPISDMLSAAIWLASLFVNKVRWRGQTLRIGKGGILVSAP